VANVKVPLPCFGLGEVRGEVEAPLDLLDLLDLDRDRDRDRVRPLTRLPAPQELGLLQLPENAPRLVGSRISLHEVAKVSRIIGAVQ